MDTFFRKSVSRRLNKEICHTFRGIYIWQQCSVNQFRSDKDTHQHTVIVFFWQMAVRYKRLPGVDVIFADNNFVFFGAVFVNTFIAIVEVKIIVKLKIIIKL